MGITAKTILAEYESLMSKTKWLSQLGVFLIGLIALFELFRVFKLVYVDVSVLDTNLYLVVKTIALYLLLITAFGLRFALLFDNRDTNRLFIYLSWWGAFVASFLYYADAMNYWQVSMFGIYSFPSDPLERTWFSFVFFSGIRFLVTLAISLVRLR